jgi:hypothetical protein
LMAYDSLLSPRQWLPAMRTVCLRVAIVWVAVFCEDDEAAKEQRSIRRSPRNV